MKIVKSMVIIVVITSIIFFILSNLFIKDTKTSVDVVCFEEDTIEIKTVDGYNNKMESIENTISGPQNILVSYNFIKDKHNSIKIKLLLDSGSNIVVENENITAHDIYEVFSIPQSCRAFKTSKTDELNDVKLPLKRQGILVFKHKDLYYAPGYNSVDTSPNNIMKMFKYNKDIVIN